MTARNDSEKESRGAERSTDRVDLAEMLYAHYLDHYSNDQAYCGAGDWVADSELGADAQHAAHAAHVAAEIKAALSAGIGDSCATNDPVRYRHGAPNADDWHYSLTAQHAVDCHVGCHVERVTHPTGIDPTTIEFTDAELELLLCSCDRPAKHRSMCNIQDGVTTMRDDERIIAAAKAIVTGRLASQEQTNRAHNKEMIDAAVRDIRDSEQRADKADSALADLTADNCLLCEHGGHLYDDCTEIVGYDHTNGDHECACPGPLGYVSTQGIADAEQTGAEQFKNWLVDQCHKAIRRQEGTTELSVSDD